MITASIMPKKRIADYDTPGAVASKRKKQRADYYQRKRDLTEAMSDTPVKNSAALRLDNTSSHPRPSCSRGRTHAFAPRAILLNEMDSGRPLDQIAQKERQLGLSAAKDTQEVGGSSAKSIYNLSDNDDDEPSGVPTLHADSPDLFATPVLVRHSRDLFNSNSSMTQTPTAVPVESEEFRSACTCSDAQDLACEHHGLVQAEQHEDAGSVSSFHDGNGADEDRSEGAGDDGSDGADDNGSEGADDDVSEGADDDEDNVQHDHDEEGQVGEDADISSLSESDEEEAAGAEDPDKRDARLIKRKYASLKHHGQVSWSMADKILRLAIKYGARTQELAEKGLIKGLQTLRKESERALPTVFTDTKFVSVVRGITRVETESRKLALDKRKTAYKQPGRRYEVITNYTDMEELRDFVIQLPAHAGMQEEDWNCLDLSVDGVAEADHSTYTMVYIAVSFLPCKKAYPWRIVRHVLHERPNLEDLYGPFVDELIDKGFTLRTFPADGKERKLARGMVQCGSAYFSCDWCYAKGCR